jgi:1-acyl-sn-glycerol-3-phosphate acyltransferase
VLRAVTDEIMYAVMNLSGQEYVDEDAQRAKKRGRKGDAVRLDGAAPPDGSAPAEGAPAEGAAPDGAAADGATTPSGAAPGSVPRPS